jgi:hypothetical protein
VGPAWQGHLDADSFTPVDQRGTRPLLAADRADLAVLAATCDAREAVWVLVPADRWAGGYRCHGGQVF